MSYVKEATGYTTVRGNAKLLVKGDRFFPLERVFDDCPPARLLIERTLPQCSGGVRWKKSGLEGRYYMLL